MKTKSQRTPVRVIDATQRLGGVPGPLEPPTKGRLFYDHQIPDAFLGGLPGIKDKLRWVRTHLPRATRIKVGRSSAWFESDIRAFLASLNDAAPGEQRRAG